MQKISPKQLKIALIVYSIILIVLAYIIYLLMPQVINGYGSHTEDPLIMLKGIGLIISVIMFLVLFTNCIGYIKGLLKTKSYLQKQLKNIKLDNPYIYFRSVPNDYGIGISSLLLDSKIEPYKDIVAVILDLCARGYLRLEKQDNNYNVRVLNNNLDNLISNEKYVMNSIIDNNLSSFDYNKWYLLCVEDGKNLELFNIDNTYVDKLKDSNFSVEDEYNKYIKRYRIICLLLSALCLLSKDGVGIIWMIFSYIILRMVLFFPLCWLPLVVRGFVNMARIAEKQTIKMYLTNHLHLTQKGIDEVHKLTSFAKFIDDFGSFASKNPEEIVIWDRYLSYAHVFALTDKIINSGYEQIVKNGSFDIDDANNINLNNINTLN